MLLRRSIRYVHGIGFVPASAQYDTAYTCYNHTMKHSSDILSHLFLQPHFKSLPRYRCFRTFLSLLKPTWRDAVAFVYMKERTFYFVLRHPGFKMEFNYNRDLLKSLLTAFAQETPECRFMGETERVVAFAGKLYTQPHEEENTVPYYRESAEGDFEIRTEDAELKKRFSSISEHIRCNQS